VCFAEQCVAKYSFTREAQDKFAIASTERAMKANTDGSFAWEIAPVTSPPRERGQDRQGRATVQGKLDKIPG